MADFFCAQFIFFLKFSKFPVGDDLLFYLVLIILTSGKGSKIEFKCLHNNNMSKKRSGK